MGSHYVPQFYLKGFAESPESDRIWVYEKGKDGFTSGIKNIANENKFYSVEIETFLANKIENPANKAIKKIREKSAITDEERNFLAKYMLVLWKRVPSQRDWYKNKSTEIIDNELDGIEQELNKLYKKKTTTRECNQQAY